jgi:quercetin 2,3-dioxygenase
LIVPEAQGGPPTWGSQPFPKGDHSGRFVAFASGFESATDALPIRARARVLGARLTVGQSIEYAIGERRHAYLVPSSGAVDVNGIRIHARDGAAIRGPLLPLPDCYRIERKRKRETSPRL